MKTRNRPFLIVVLALFAFCIGALAQVTNSPPGIADVDQKIADTISKFSYWKTLIVPLTLILVAAIKKWVAFIPDKWLPWTGPIIGGLLDLLASKFGFWTGDAGAGAAMGGLATWAHQALFVQPASGGSDYSNGDGEAAKSKVPMILLIAALSFGFVAPMTTGCSIFGNPQRTAEAKKFDTFTSVYEAARGTYKAFKRECFYGRVTAANEKIGRQAWDDFRLAYDKAFKVGMGDTPATTEFLELKNRFIQIILTHSN